MKYIPPLFTSEEILANPYCTQDHDRIRYLLTQDEWKWVEFIRGRYSIADFILNNMEEDEDGNCIVTIDYWEMSEALHADNGNYPEATCLSDETALQHIFFYNFIEQDEEE